MPEAREPWENRVLQQKEIGREEPPPSSGHVLDRLLVAVKLSYLSLQIIASPQLPRLTSKTRLIASPCLPPNLGVCSPLCHYYFPDNVPSHIFCGNLICYELWHLFVATKLHCNVYVICPTHLTLPYVKQN